MVNLSREALALGVVSGLIAACGPSATATKSDIYYEALDGYRCFAVGQDDNVHIIYAYLDVANPEDEHSSIHGERVTIDQDTPRIDLEDWNPDFDRQPRESTLTVPFYSKTGEPQASERISVQIVFKGWEPAGGLLRDAVLECIVYRADPLPSNTP